MYRLVLFLLILQLVIELLRGVEPTDETIGRPVTVDVVVEEVLHHHLSPRAGQAREVHYRRVGDREALQLLDRSGVDFER